MAAHILKGDGDPITLGIIPPEIGMHFVNEAANPKEHWLSVGDQSATDWIKVPEENGAGATTFTDLTDTPSAYQAGDAGKVVSVNSTEDGLEFTTQATGALPSGGDTDDLLTKNSNADFDTSFKPLSDQPSFQDHETRITTNETDISTNTGNISQNSTDISNNTANITQNTTDISANKSDITALQNDKEDKANKSVADGYASLDTNVRVPKVELPDDIVYEDELGATITIKQNQTVWVDVAEGDDTLTADRGNIDQPFQTIKAAVDYVTTQTPTDGNDWVVQVNPGVYVEQPMTVPRNTQVRGTSDFKTNIFPTVDTAPLFEVGIFSNLANLNLDGRVGVVGANSTNFAVSLPFAAGNTFENMLINNFENGLQAISGAGTDVDALFSNVSIGQLGPVDNPVVAAGGTNASFENFFCQSSGATIFNLDNCKVRMDGGLAANALLVAQLDNNSNLSLFATNLVNIDRCAVVNGSRFQFDGGEVTGNSTDDFVDAGTGNPKIFIDGITVEGFINVLETSDGAGGEIYISDCVFNTAPDSIALNINGFANVQVKDTTFLSATKTNTIAVDAGERGVNNPFLDIYNCLFFNYGIGIIADTGQVTSRDCLFEIFGDRTGTTGINLTGNAGAFIIANLFLCDTGCKTENDSVANLENCRFVFSTKLDFEQLDNSSIRLNNSLFNEDEISATSWNTGVRGTYLSTKTNDTALVVVDQLKVGVPEFGRITTLGEGAAHGRGMLVYEYDAVTDTYEDVSDDARDPTGESVGIPNTTPNSAMYIGSELITESSEPFLFPAINFITDQPAIEGDGALISEIWDGATWIPVRTMVTEAQAPFRVVTFTSTLTNADYNARFPITVERDWRVSDPIEPPLGENYYWFRYRVASNWFDNRWEFRIPFSVDPVNVASQETLYPMYFDLANITIDNFWNSVRSDGADIIITLGDGVSQLALEVVTIDTIGRTGHIFFLESELENADTNEYFIYYGNPTATAAPPISPFGSTTVWQDYQAVYHVEDGPNDFADSTINSYTANSPNGMTSVSGVAFGNATQTVDNNSWIEPPNTSEFTDPGNILIYECWVTFSGNDKRRAMSLSNNQTQTNRDDYFGIFGATNGNAGFDWFAGTNTSSVNIADGNLHNLVLTYDGSNIKAYVDGVKVFDVAQTGNIQSSNFPLRFANRGNAGGTFFWPNSEVLDEFRIAKVVRSEGWWETQFSMMNDAATFYTIGTEETQLSAVSTSIDQAPTYKQLRLIPNSTQIANDGFVQYFGKSRPLIDLPVGVQDFTDTAGSDAAAAGDQIWFTKTFGVSSKYRLLEDVTTRITLVAPINNIIDTSSSFQVRIHYVPRGGGEGDILFRLIGTSSGEDTTFYTLQDDAPQVSENEVTEFVLKNVSTDQNNKDEFVTVALEFPISKDQDNFDSRADLIWFTIERIGSSTLDTYNGPIDISTIQVLAPIWRQGQHSEFL